jgi:hypothetical protein
MQFFETGSKDIVAQHPTAFCASLFDGALD